MRNLTEDNITDAAIATMENASDPRLKQVMTSLIKHLHGFIRDVEPSEEEWLAGIKFLTEVGQMCDDVRQEYILFSDVLGATILVDAINHRKEAGATESSVLGPFYLEGAPEVASGSDLTGDTEGEPVVVRGHVKDVQGNPIPAAELDVWQTAPNGLYDIQDPDQPEFNLRAKVRAGTRWRLQIPHHEAGELSNPERWTGGRSDAVRRPPFPPASAHSLHCQSRGVRTRRHPALYRR